MWRWCVAHCSCFWGFSWADLARADPPAPAPEPILQPLAPGQVLRIGPTAGTGTPTRDYGIGATDLCEFVEFPTELLQVCGDSFASEGVGFGGWLQQNDSCGRCLAVSPEAVVELLRIGGEGA